MTQRRRIAAALALARQRRLLAHQQRLVASLAIDVAVKQHLRRQMRQRRLVVAAPAL
jgi:hypothetical protein